MLDVMVECKHIPGITGVLRQLLPDFFPDLILISFEQGMLGVDAAPPEHKLSSELIDQAIGLHISGGHLKRIQGINTKLDESGNQFVY